MEISNQVEAEWELSAVREYLEGGGSLNKIVEKYSVCRSTLQKWLLNYELFGEVGLQHRRQNQYYPEALKRQLSTVLNTAKTIKGPRLVSAAPINRFTVGCVHIMQVDWRNCAVPMNDPQRGSLMS